MRARVRFFACAACGGALPADSQEASARCAFCGTDNYLADEDLPRVFWVEPALDEHEASRVVRRETSVGIVEKGFSRDLRIERRDLVFIPFNAARALKAGRVVVMERDPRSAPARAGDPSFTQWEAALMLSVAGISARASGAGPGPGQGREEGPARADTKVVIAEALSCAPACEARALGADGIAIERNVFGKDGRPLIPWSRERVAELGTSIEPVIHPKELRAGIEEDAAGARANGGEIEIVACEVMQVYYPVWVVLGTWECRSHRFVVDAIDGTVLEGRAPASLRRRATVGTASVVTAALPLALVGRGAAWWLSPDGGGGLAAGPWVAGVAVAALVAALAWAVLITSSAAAQFRLGREVSWAGGASREETVDLGARETWVERLGTGMLEALGRALAGRGRRMR